MGSRPDAHTDRSTVLQVFNSGDSTRALIQHAEAQLTPRIHRVGPVRENGRNTLHGNERGVEDRLTDRMRDTPIVDGRAHPGTDGVYQILHDGADCTQAIHGRVCRLPRYKRLERHP